MFSFYRSIEKLFYSKMRALIVLYIFHFFIYTIFLYVFNYTYDNPIKNMASIGIQSFVILLGGILASKSSMTCYEFSFGFTLAAFVIPAFFFYILSMGCLIFCVALFKFPIPDITTKWGENVLIGISFGLFKFLNWVLILDQVITFAN